MENVIGVVEEGGSGDQTESAISQQDIKALMQLNLGFWLGWRLCQHSTILAEGSAITLY